MADADLYKLLGVEPTATAEEIGKAFRKRAALDHPDKHPGDAAAAEHFKALSAAYHLLTDPEKRARYDLSRPRPQPREEPRRGYSTDSIMDEIFGVRAARSGARPGPRPPDPYDIFGGAPGPAAPGTGGPSYEDMFGVKPGLDANATIEVTFAESVMGCKKQVRVRVAKATDQCKACSGTGGVPGSRRATCGTCSGHGRQMDPRRMQVRTCRTCRGMKTVPLSPCRTCGGRGTVELEREITVTVPRGVKDGDVLRVAGMGGPGSPPGDLYLEVKVAQDGVHERAGGDLRIKKKVTLKKAILGGSVSVEAYPGKIVEFEVPPGSQPGAEVRSEQVRLPGGETVSVVLVLDVALPKRLSARGRKLLEELTEEISRTEVT